MRRDGFFIISFKCVGAYCIFASMMTSTSLRLGASGFFCIFINAGSKRPLSIRNASKLVFHGTLNSLLWLLSSDYFYSCCFFINGIFCASSTSLPYFLSTSSSVDLALPMMCLKNVFPYPISRAGYASKSVGATFHPITSLYVS